jgi:hypothetical protein
VREKPIRWKLSRSFNTFEILLFNSKHIKDLTSLVFMALVSIFYSTPSYKTWNTTIAESLDDNEIG